MPLMYPSSQTSNYGLTRNLYEQSISFPFDNVDAYLSLPIILICRFTGDLYILPADNG